MRERERVAGIMEEEIVCHFGLGGVECVARDIEPGDAAVRQELRELIEEEAAAAADVEDAGAVFQFIALDELLRDDGPAAVVLVTAVSVATVAVPVVAIEAPGDV